MQAPCIAKSASKNELIPPPPPVLLLSAPPPLPLILPSTQADDGNWSNLAIASTLPPSVAPSLQPFVCDEAGAGSGTAQFVSASGHLWLQLAIDEKSDVVIGTVFNNVQGLQLTSLVLDYKGDVNNTFGPWLVVSYKLPSGKLAGRVVPFTQASTASGAPDGYNRIAFTPSNLSLPQQVTINSLEIIAIGENSTGSISLGDITVNGAKSSQLMTTKATCEFVP